MLKSYITTINKCQISLQNVDFQYLPNIFIIITLIVWGVVIMSNIIMIGERIRMLRINKGLTQKDLGNILNMNKTTISHYEKGERCPSIETLIQISDYFGVDITYVLGMNNIGKSYDSEIKLSDEEIIFVKEIRKIPGYKNLIVNPKGYAKLIALRTTDYKM